MLPLYTITDDPACAAFLPKRPKDRSFGECVQTLKGIWARSNGGIHCSWSAGSKEGKRQFGVTKNQMWVHHFWFWGLIFEDLRVINPDQLHNFDDGSEYDKDTVRWVFHGGCWQDFFDLEDGWEERGFRGTILKWRSTISGEKTWAEVCNN